MMSRLIRRTIFLPLALVMSLVTAGQATASWSAPVAVTPSGSDRGALASPGGSVALVAYWVSRWESSDDGLFVRRSVDGGTTWDDPVLLSADADSGTPAIAARGAHVDVVWEEQKGLRYAHSVDGGRTFAPPIVLEAPSWDAGFILTMPSVVRGRDGFVAVAWRWFWSSSESTGGIRMKVSTDAGATFGTATSIVSGVVSGPSLALGDDVLYLAFTRRSDLRVTRSRDAGRTWSGRVLLGRSTWFDTPAIVARGREALIAYRAVDHGAFVARYVRTGSRGRTWSSPRWLANDAGTPFLSLAGGVIRVAMATTSNRALYRASRDGLTWSRPRLVNLKSPTSAEGDSASLLGVGFADAPLVLFSVYEDGAVNLYVRHAR